MTIAERIEKIIAKRNGSLKKRFEDLEPKAKALIEFAHEISSLKETGGVKSLQDKIPKFREIWDEHFKDLGETTNDNLDESTNDEINTISKLVSAIKKKVGEIGKEKQQPIWAGSLAAAHSRISKDVIEICIMGPVSTGKSTFLRGLTGAPDYVLPTGNDKTTAARSTFVNSEEKKAVITFYTKGEFRDIINTYVKELNNSKIEDKPPLPELKEDDDIKDYCTKLIQDDKTFNTTNYKSRDYHSKTGILITDYFDTFKRYVQNVNDYLKYLGHKEERLYEKEINNKELEPFVSYRFPKDQKATKEKDHELYCRAFAVKEAKIYWPLVCGETDLGYVSFVDTMGIGEPKFLVEQDLLDIVKSRADLALALCCLKSNDDSFDSGHEQDKNFLSLLSKLKDRELQNWIYYLCNRHSDSCNEENFKEKILKQMEQGDDGFSLKPEYWESLRFKMEDKINTGDIADFLKSKLLRHLESDIERMDDFFISDAENTIEDLYEKMRKWSTALELLLGAVPSMASKKEHVDYEVLTLFKNFREAIKDLLNTMNAKNETHCKTITGDIYPLLSNPEIFAIIKTDRPDIEFKSTEKNDNNVYDLRQDEKTRHSIMIALNNCRREYPDLESKGILDQYERDLNDEESKAKNKVQELKNYIGKNKEFLVEWLDDTAKVITYINQRICAQVDPTPENYEVQTFGRELRCFYELREKIFKGVYDRTKNIKRCIDDSEKDNDQPQKEDSNQSQGGKKLTLYEYFNGKGSDYEGETQKLQKEIANKLFGIYDSAMNDNHEPVAGTERLRKLANDDKEGPLGKAISDFLEKKVDLNEIVRTKAKNNLLDSLLHVNLQYHGIEDIAYSFFRCLFDIDYRLRTRLCEMYIDTFREYHIYETLYRNFFNDVFDYNAESKPAYLRLKNIIEERISKNYDSTDIGKCDAAIKCIKNMLELTKKKFN